MRYPKERKPRPTPESKALDCIRVNVSKEMRKFLETMAYERKSNLSAIVAIALDNERTHGSFDLTQDLDLSDIPYVDENSPESVRLYEFIKKHPGLSIDHLVLCRREFGVESRRDVAIAYRHLLTIEMIEEYKPVRSYYYPDNYRLVRKKPDEKLYGKDYKKYRNDKGGVL